MSKQEDNIDYPEGVVNKEAYRDWLEKLKHPILNEKRMHVCSDDTIANLGKLPHHLLKDIEHLPDEEKSKIMNLKTVFFKINNNANVAKRHAFGLKFGVESAMEHNPLIKERKEEILEYFGRMFTVDELMKVIVTDWKLPISRDALYSFRKANALEIEKRIEKFKSSYSDIRLGVKRSRLEELVWLYGRAKDKYEQSRNREDYKILLQTLEAIRKESEGDKLTIDGKLDINHEIDVSKHLREEVFKTMNIKEIILGRVAARMGVNSVKLINSLNNSFYSKFSSVVQEQAEDVVYEPVFPSTQNYDFDKIKQLNAIQVAKDAEITDTLPKDNVKALSIKDLIKAKLKAKQDGMKKISGEIKSDTEMYNKTSKTKVINEMGAKAKNTAKNKKKK